MKVISEKILKNKKRRVVLELEPHELGLMVINRDHFYKLAGQVEDIVQGHVLLDSEKVHWCSITQEWVAA
jgi:predicted glycosyltransferase involved in capsule biosynthesis